MTNKMFLNTVYTIALFAFTGIAIAEPSDSEVTSSQYEQKRTNDPGYLAMELTQTPVINPVSLDPENDHTMNSDIKSDNFDYIPESWYSGY